MPEPSASIVINIVFVGLFRSQQPGNECTDSDYKYFKFGGDGKFQHHLVVLPYKRVKEVIRDFHFKAKLNSRKLKCFAWIGVFSV